MSEKLISIRNKDQINNIIENAKFNTDKYGTIVIFTNGNEWYISTLINNLLKSIEIHEKFEKIIVFCSDKNAHKQCEKLGFKYFEFVDIPELNVDQIFAGSDATTDSYTRLTFVKTILIKHILDLGYTPLYLDPDMALLKPSILHLLSYIDLDEFVCAGTYKHINSNIMIAKPTNFTKNLFKVTLKDVNEIIDGEDTYGDEDLLRPRLKNKSFALIDYEQYPNGSDAVKYKNVARIIHSNCIVGLENKINLMKKTGAWFLPMFDNIWFPSCLNIYPPLLKGKLIETRFYEYVTNNNITLNRKYINIGWTNLYCNSQFKGKHFNQKKLQLDLDSLPNKDKYFTILQYDCNIRERIPENTVVFGGSEGTYPIPLLYDNNEIFKNVEVKSWSEKNIFCSFVGQHSHPLRQKVFNYIEGKKQYYYYRSDQDKVNTQLFIDTTINSKFCLAPRGFGRSSFRFFEALKLGSVPIYIWDDKIWLPFQDRIDYNKLAIVINVSELENLDNILTSITEEKYNSMIAYAEENKHICCSFESVCEEIVRKINS